MFDVVFVLVIIYTMVQGPTLPWLAPRLRWRRRGGTATWGWRSRRWRGCRALTDGVDRSRLNGVEVDELRLPPGPR